jgi:hypothetical protein
MLSEFVENLPRSLVGAVFACLISAQSIQTYAEDGPGLARRLAEIHSYYFTSDLEHERHIAFVCRNLAEDASKGLDENSKLSIQEELSGLASNLIAERKRAGAVLPPIDRLSIAFLKLLSNSDLEKLVAFRSSAPALSIQPVLAQLTKRWYENRGKSPQKRDSIPADTLSRRRDYAQLGTHNRLLIEQMAVDASTMPEKIEKTIQPLIDAEIDRIWSADADDLDRDLASIPDGYREQYRAFLDSDLGKRERRIVTESKREADNEIDRIVGSLAVYQMKNRDRWRSGQR